MGQGRGGEKEGIPRVEGERTLSRKKLDTLTN